MRLAGTVLLVNTEVRSVTKTSVAIIEGGFCQHCGLPAPDKATKRFRFCNDTCRQAAYRARTGKSATAGTVRLKSPIPLPAERGDCKYFVPGWVEREMALIKAAFANQCKGVIEVYSREHGRGVLDLFRPWIDSQNVAGTVHTPRQLFGGFWKLFSTPHPNSRVWETARCRFKDKHWYYLSWKDVWLLEYHPQLPSALKWIHSDPTRRIRRSRFVHVNFSQHGVSYDSRYGTMVLTWQPPDPTMVQQVLNESTGGNNDAVYSHEVNMEHFDKADADGSDSQDQC